MTTIAVRDGVMACDSKVSGSYPCSTNKIRKRADCLIGYAGDWVAGAHYVDAYIANKEPTRSDSDDVELLILKDSGKIFYVDTTGREVEICEKFYAIGSGSQAAYTAMLMGATAVEAVKMAIKVDDWSGGRVRHLCLRA